jgi:hypothetical protein
LWWLCILIPPVPGYNPGRALKGIITLTDDIVFINLSLLHNLNVMPKCIGGKQIKNAHPIFRQTRCVQLFCRKYICISSWWLCIVFKFAWNCFPNKEMHKANQTRVGLCASYDGASYLNSCRYQNNNFTLHQNATRLDI